MGLCAEVVYFPRLDSADDLDQACPINEISIVKDHFALSVVVWIVIQMGNSTSIERGATANDSMHLGVNQDLIILDSSFMHSRILKCLCCKLYKFDEPYFRFFRL